LLQENYWAEKYEKLLHLWAKKLEKIENSAKRRYDNEHVCKFNIGMWCVFYSWYAVIVLVLLFSDDMLNLPLVKFIVPQSLLK